MNISILWGGESQAYVRQSRSLDIFICLLKIREPIVMISTLVVFIFPLELEKQSVASVIIKPLLSLKKPVCLGRFFAKKFPLLTNWKIFDKICNWPSY